MRHGMSGKCSLVCTLCICSLIILLGGVQRSNAEQMSLPEELLKTFIETKFAQYQSIETFYIEGSILVEMSPEGLALLAADRRESEKAKNIKFQVWGSEDKTKMRIEELDSKGVPTSVIIFYVDGSTYVYESANQSPYASVFSNDQKPSNQTFYDWFPGFADVSFLNEEVSYFGLPALTPERLKKSLQWNGVLKNLKAVNSMREGLFEAGFENGKNKILVDFEKNSKGAATLKGVRFSDASGNLLRKVDFERVSFENGIEMPTKFVLSTYVPLGKDGAFIPMAKWRYEITEFSINKNIESSQITFDPTMVDHIWDNSEEAWINVPK